MEKEIEKEKRWIEEWNAGVRKERQKEKQELKWRIVAGEVLGYIRKVKCLGLPLTRGTRGRGHSHMHAPWPRQVL